MRATVSSRCRAAASGSWPKKRSANGRTAASSPRSATVRRCASRKAISFSRAGSGSVSISTAPATRPGAAAIASIATMPPIESPAITKRSGAAASSRRAIAASVSSRPTSAMCAGFSEKASTCAA